MGRRKWGIPITEISKCRLVAAKWRNFTENYTPLLATPYGSREIAWRRILRRESFNPQESGVKLICRRNYGAVSDSTKSDTGAVCFEKGLLLRGMDGWGAPFEIPRRNSEKRGRIPTRRINKFPSYRQIRDRVKIGPFSFRIRCRK